MSNPSLRSGLHIGPVEHCYAATSPKFTDATIPAGTRTVIYRIVAVRSTARGDVAEFPVNLGVSGKMPAQFLPRDQYNAAA